MTVRETVLPPMFRWTLAGRTVVFFLAATSILSLLAEFYGLCSMRAFTFAVLLPASLLLFVLASIDFVIGDRRLYRGIFVGAVAGFLAAIAYDVFRLPFVYSSTWHLNALVPQMNLFKVFPRFGALIRGEPLNQTRYSIAAHWIGWAYHFSNGITFGIMYTALIGDGRRHNWGWAVVFAVGLELGMLLTPYPGFFDIQRTLSFVIITLSAHVIFGMAMGLIVKSLSLKVEQSPQQGSQDQFHLR